MGRLVGGASGLSSGLVGGKSYQRFIANGDWIKPAGATLITFEIIGGGGAGCGGWDTSEAVGPNDVAGGGGGGGGSMKRYSMPASAVPNFLTVVVGATANGVTGSGTAAGDGEDGNPSSISDGAFTMTAYGGAGGEMGPGNYSGVGGGGGGLGGAGEVGTPGAGGDSSGSAGSGGAPHVNGLTSTGTSNHFSAGGGGGSGCQNSGGNLANSGKSAEFGGGGGGAPNNSIAGGSIFGAGGGGGDGGWYVPTHGGAWGNYTQGGTENGGSNGDAIPTNAPATAGTSRAYGCGDGGAGLHDDEANDSREIGGAGGTPGGGGGASGKNSTGHVPGGAGGRGEVRIWSW